MRWQTDDLTFSLALPRTWFGEAARSRLPDPVVVSADLLQGGQVLRLLAISQKPTQPQLELACRTDKEGKLVQGRGKLRWPESTGAMGGAGGASCELEQALDGSYQVERSGLRGSVAPTKQTRVVLHEAQLWFALGRLLKLGVGEQSLTLVREGAAPGLLVGTLTLTEERTESLALKDGPVSARRFRYTTRGLGYPKERERGTLWIGPGGEVLQSDLTPERNATGPLVTEKGMPAYLLPTLSGWRLRAEQRGELWALTLTEPGKPAPVVEAELDASYRPRSLTSRLAGTPLGGSWEAGELRYAYTALPPSFVRPPESALVLTLASLLVPDPAPGLLVGQRRPLLLFPLLTGETLALEGALERLPDPTPKSRAYQLTLPDGLRATLRYDTLGLTALQSNQRLAITRAPIKASAHAG